MTKASGTTSSRAHRAPAAGRPRFPIVGVVASAGGLEAFTKLLQAMPADSGMALVLIPHLDPSHSSMMAELLGRHTPMPVSEATDGRRVDPDHVYVIPPNADLVVRDGVLRVVTAAHAPGRTAIDSFLESLAADQQEWSAGIVLSGTGSHGAQGVRAVKAAGGVVFAQTPDSAAQAQMPRAAIATGVVDEVLPPEQMPPALVRHLRAPAPPSLAATDLGAVLAVLRLQLKRDFRGYRTPMLSRRIHRRMALHGSASIADYAEFLRADPQEARALVRDLSIGVTAFFREPDAFHALERVAIPDLVAQRRRGSDGERPVRVWVPGCSTGEEAYSLGMLLFEQLAAAGLPTHLQIFATDADAAALEVAREGNYSDTAVAGLSPERLRQFFVRVDEHRYQVSPALREAVTFAEQNLVSDAPFSRLDLISCRNVLIYLEPAVQAKVIALFHFALNEGGYLMLGPAESVSSPAGRFEPLSKRWRVYRRVGTGRPLVDIPILPVAGFQTGRPRAADTARPKAYGELLHRALLSDYAPAAALVNRRLEILSIQGPLGDFIEFPPGEWTRDLLSLARPGLRAAIRAVCHDALEERRAAAVRRARVKRGGAYVACTVSARPVGASSELDALAAVTFQDGGGTRASAPATPVRVAAGTDIVAQLQAELLGTREELQGTIDELQAANEELKGSHEELLSVNEELQSTNEELETSKEELQSLNEELNTVNSQLQEKVRELDAANNDLVNLLASTEIASVFLDATLLIKRFTTSALTLFNLLPSDLGRPFSDIRPHFQDAALLDDCREVLARLVPSEAMVQGPAGQAYLRRVLPYRTADRRIDGVVILWFDITPRLAAEAGARHLRAVLADTQDAIALVALDGRITSWNRAAERLYGYTEAEACARALSDLTAPSGQEAVSASFRRIATGQTPSESASTVRLTKDGRTRDVWATMTALRDSTGQPVTVLLTEQDVTVIIEGRLAKDTVTLYERLVDRLPVGAVLRSDGQVSLNRAAEALTGYARTELTTAEAWFRLLHADEPAARERYEAGATGRAEVMTFVRKDGVARTMGLTVTPIDATRALWTFIDATESLQAEAALRESGDYLRSVIDTVADAVITINEHGTIDVFNPAAERLFGYGAADAVGMNLRELMPSPHREAHEDYVTRYLTTRVPHIIGTSTEITARHKDGTLFPAQLTVGEIDHRRRFVGVLHDLRGRRALEWRLADSQIEERRHMARELHDEIGGHMTGIGLLAQSLHTALAAAHSPLAAQAREVIETIALAHQRLRAVIRGLMPVDTVPNGLTIALGELVAQSQSISGVMCRLQADSPAPVDDPETALHLYRIVQEALNNALRHAHATAVVVTLSRSGDRIEIAVSDDGQGLKAPAAHDGIGLKAMQQRARLLGGECVIEPRPGGGTTVRCWAPTGGGRRGPAAAPTSQGRGPR